MQAEARFQDIESVDESSVAEAAPSADADRDALADRLNKAREQVQALARDLRGVDAELDDLATAREQHQMLLDVCTKLDELSAVGAAELFWGDRAAVEAGAEQVSLARSRVDDFGQYVKAIEERRAAIVQRLTLQQQHSDLLEDDLFEALEEEERRQQEWVVEREMDALPARQSVMPWTRGNDEDKRFRKSLGTALLLCVLFALIVPYIPLPTLSPQAEPDVPERVVRLMVKEKPKPVPPREQVRPQPKPVEQKVAKQAPQSPVVPDKEVVDKAGAAPDEPVDQGILAFREQFAGLQQDQVVARLGSQAHVDNAGAGATRIERKMLTTNAPGSSGGINLGSLSRGVSGPQGTSGMTGTQVTRVTSQIGGIGKPGQDRPLSGDGVSQSRTDEEIQIVFDRHKAALYRLYNRELRKDPTLQGQMVLRLTIEPDGSVSMCQLHASDMNAPDLAAQVVERVKTIDFGAKEGISAITILYPIDFLPAA
jgi:hypothetical protein